MVSITYTLIDAIIDYFANLTIYWLKVLKVVDIMTIEHVSDVLIDLVRIYNYRKSLFMYLS